MVVIKLLKSNDLLFYLRVFSRCFPRQLLLQQEATTD
jgi:hypothetical protein